MVETMRTCSFRVRDSQTRMNSASATAHGAVVDHIRTKSLDLLLYRCESALGHANPILQVGQPVGDKIRGRAPKRLCGLRQLPPELVELLLQLIALTFEFRTLRSHVVIQSGKGGGQDLPVCRRALICARTASSIAGADTDFVLHAPQPRCWALAHT